MAAINVPPKSSQHEPGAKALAPLWVGVAILLLPPLGIYLLWKHPVLGNSPVWRKAAYAWCAVWCIAQVSNAVTGERKTTSSRTTRSKASGAKATATPRNPQGSPEYQEAYKQGYAEASYWVESISQEIKRKSPAMAIDANVQALRSVVDTYASMYREAPVERTRGLYEGAKAAAGQYAR